MLFHGAIAQMLLTIVLFSYSRLFQGFCGMRFVLGTEMASLKYFV